MKKKEIEQAAIKHYGNDPHLYAAQRDGFIVGANWKENSINNSHVPIGEVIETIFYFGLDFDQASLLMDKIRSLIKP